MEFIYSLTPFIFDWLDLIVRWIHIIVGIAWIGTSFYFNWLDSRLDRDINKDDIDGELWSVHSGGFYHINKLKGPPKSFPKELHWFKWEAYTTWISGFALLIIVYYLNAESIMIDKNINDISPFIAIIISLIFLLGSWFIYDFLCKSKLINNIILFSIICIIIATFLSYLLTEIYGSRAAYIHVGACLGTIMAANVFRVIIPSQKNMVESALNNKQPDLKKGLDAKTRSIHNNYITLPVLFIMISSHFPFTYGHHYNWLILLFISIIGASVRHYFNLRNKKQHKVWILPIAALGMFLLMLYVSVPKIIQKDMIKTTKDQISFSEINNIIKYRCGVCHMNKPTFEGFDDPPLGLVFESPDDIVKNIEKIKAQVIDSDIMPPGNLTGITDEERNKIRLWIESGANINN
ncbi:MAG: hypothetical protein CFH16_00642 [Alphaproteobacteria bacterium MarineAlpha5_Bin6]|nr:MAG: hypothetical protein CFH16_00642 [Alphaproteobacteria bacterium MarineAlpha5_Bin6]